MKRVGFHERMALPTAIILLVLAAGLPVLTGCGGEVLPSHRPSDAMVIDGRWGDWEELPIHRVKEMEGLAVALANDDQYLYLMARSTDLQLARLLRMRGLVVRASGMGGDGSDLNIRYHGSVALSDHLMRAGGGPGDGRMPMPFETGEGVGLPVPGMIEVEKGGRVAVYGERRPEGAAAGSDIDGDIFCFEFRLPLDTLFAGAARDGGVAGRQVRLELAGGKMTREMREQTILLRNSRGGKGEGGGAMGVPGNEPRRLTAVIKLS